MARNIKTEEINLHVYTITYSANVVYILHYIYFNILQTKIKGLKNILKHFFEPGSVLSEDIIMYSFQIHD